MGWALLASVVVVLWLRVARRRREPVSLLPSQPISTIDVEMSKKHTAKTRVALDAATAALR